LLETCKQAKKMVMANISTVQVSIPSHDDPRPEQEGPAAYIGELPAAMQAQALKLLALLHTNLDIERLLQAFSR